MESAATLDTTSSSPLHLYSDPKAVIPDLGASALYRGHHFCINYTKPLDAATTIGHFTDTNGMARSSSPTPDGLYSSHTLSLSLSLGVNQRHVVYPNINGKNTN